jgi:hypothetical protein
LHVSLPPEQTRLRASLAGLESWARTPDRTARTQPARDARWQQYIERARALAPEGADQADIEYRADCLRRADMQRMALKSARARSPRKTNGPTEAA